jgi:cell division protein ZapA (FtsZ GTPase activity inhibitor)
MKGTNVRVNVPTNPEQLLALAQRVYDKHSELGEQSPLSTMVSHSWTANGAKIAQCLAYHKQAEEAKRQMEELYRQRDLLLSGIKESVKASRDILQGVYRENQKTLGDFGFNIDDTPKNETLKKQK